AGRTSSPAADDRQPVRVRYDTAMAWRGAYNHADGRSSAEKQASDIRIVEQVAPFPGERQLAGNQHIADIRELEALAGVLFDHDDGLAVGFLQVAQYVEHHVDIARLETDRRLVDQQQFR